MLELEIPRWWRNGFGAISTIQGGRRRWIFWRGGFTRNCGFALFNQDGKEMGGSLKQLVVWWWGFTHNQWVRWWVDFLVVADLGWNKLHGGGRFL